MSWQRIKVKVRKDLKPLQRKAIGLEIIEHIKRRTSQGLDKTGRPWKGKAGEYSKSYQNSLDFKIAKGGGGVVNLELSSEMMNSIEVLSTSKGEITIGYDKGNNQLNAKVEGNRLGTYGQAKPIRGKKRDFLGIEKSKLNEIQNAYDYNKNDRKKVKQKIEKINKLLGS